MVWSAGRLGTTVVVRSPRTVIRRSRSGQRDGDDGRVSEHRSGDLVIAEVARRLRRLSVTFSDNYFLLPAVSVVAAALVARLLPDVALGVWTGSPTVESARAVLTTVAAATITFASIAFSVSLLMIQQGSSQFSPRVVHNLTRDSFNRRVVAVVVATFAFCLVSLTRVREATDPDDDPAIPDLAVTIAIIAGIVAVMAVVAGLHHTSHQLDVSRVLGRIVDDTVAAVGKSTDGTADDESIQCIRDRHAASVVPEGPCTTIRFDADGWICDLDRRALLSVAPPGGHIRIETYPGSYAVHHAVLARIWPPVGDAEFDDTETTVRNAVHLAATRTLDDDASYGVRQLVDVALRALSPGVNDPTTARDAIAHLTTVLVRFAVSDDPPSVLVVDDEGARTLLLPHVPTMSSIAELALAELRRAAADEPDVALALFEMVGRIVTATDAVGAPERSAPFVAQADQLMEQIERTAMLDADRDRLVRARSAVATRQVHQPTGQS